MRQLEQASKPAWRVSLPKPAWRWLIPIFLVLLFLSTLLWLPWQAQRMEANERQEQLVADTLWMEQAIRFQLGRDEESLQVIGTEINAGILSGEKLHERLNALVKNNHEIARIIWLDADGKSWASSDDMPLPPSDYAAQAKAAGERARHIKIAQYSAPATAAWLGGRMVMNYSLPLYIGAQYRGSLLASFPISTILDELVPWWFAQSNEILLIDGDENVVGKRVAGGPGLGVYTQTHALDLPGVSLALRTNSVKSAPRLLPNLLVGTVIALSLGLLWSLLALWRDINRRLAAEGALRQQVSFMSAMENSLFTGLRARDLEGRITYVNPAFCQMVGIPADELVGKQPPMPYWAPEAMDEYQARFSKVLAGTATPQFETTFQRSDGERFPVLIFESPLVDDSGQQTGWMGSILDISDRKRAEDLNHQQQEKLQASARLASMGEIASMLAHELNQPLSAISSYTTGALNLLNDASVKADIDMLKPVLEKTGAQAQRAGLIIRSVRAFAKKREQKREAARIEELIDNVMPLIELQARQFFVVLQTHFEPGLPAVLVDRVLLEQVILNLTRNGIESMQHVAPERRLLHIVASTDHASSSPNVIVDVIDRGQGIPTEVAERLFSPFFSTKAEGMGMGLNICRTVVELHGGTLAHTDNPDGGTIFRFTLPVQ